MDIGSLEPRIVATIGLLAILPALWYGVGMPGTGGYVAALNVVIVVAALWVLFRPVAATDGSDVTG